MAPSGGRTALMTTGVPRRISYTVREMTSGGAPQRAAFCAAPTAATVAGKVRNRGGGGGEKKKTKAPPTPNP
jgi:hypothetical protein